MNIIGFRYETRNSNYWKERGIDGPKPLLFIGNMWGIWKWVQGHVDRQRAAEYGKVYGIYEGNKPLLMISDAFLIRSIFIKDFYCFTSRRVF